MVRILTCHHFGGQKIGRCEEALQLAVADDLIIVALEHQVAVYSSELSSSSDGHSEHSKLTQGATRDGGDIGSSPIFFMKKPGGGGKRKATVNSKGGSELVLSHSFPTVDLIDSISYNGRGNYLLCLEKRESSDGKQLSRSVRVYFNWDTSKEGKPMRARIAGLVSPTGADPDDDTLVMVEIPTTSPTGSSPPPNIVGAASCNILGHLATLTDTNVVNIYAYKLKEVKGRASKSQYSDFDLSYAVEVTNFSPDSARIEFLADIIAVSNEATVHVFRLTKQARTRSRTASNDSGGSFTSSGRRSVLSGASSIAGNTVSGPASLPNPPSHKTEQVFDKVVFDPKNESVKVHMNLITRANQKNRFPDAGAGIHEVYQEMISSKTKLIYSANAPALSIEDLLRIGIGHESSPSIVQVGLYPVKIKDDLGGISCIVGMSSQALVYHVPAKLDCNVVRVVTYPLTAPLVSFAFDSLFFHALTETGLETYTSRSLYYPLKEFEGFQRHHNDCPFIDETPSLVGIRPFMGVRYMAANEFLLCLLASPSITHSTSASPSFVEDSLWTIYALQLPSIELLCEDLSKASQAAKAGNLDTFVTLATELHLVLRTHVNMYPESEPHFRKQYQKTCNAIGMEYWKKATIRYDEAIQLSEGTDKYRLENQAEDALDKGVTFLTMAGVNLKHIFEEEPNLYLKDRSIVRGVTRFVSVALRNAEGQPVSPKLTATVTDFLLSQSPETLVDLATEVPLLRETNSAKLIQIIRKLAESSGYKRAECVALLLTLVTAGGCESGTRSSVKEVLQKCKAKDNLDSSFKLQWLMDFKVVSKPKLTDLAICLSTARPSLPATVISQQLEKSKVSIGQVLMAFSQGINLSSDVDVQNSLTQTMTTILEKYFTEKLKAASNRQAIYNNLANQVNYENGLVSSKPTLKPLDVATVDLTDDETHAVNTLARSYVSRIALKPATQPQRHNSGETNAHASMSPTQAPKEPSEDAKKAAEAPKSTLTEAKVTPFGKLPNFIVHIIKETHTFVNSNVTAFQVTALLPGVTEETKEFFMKLGSLLTSPLGNAAGVKDVVLNFLETKGQPGAPLHVCLEILAASYDKAVQALIAKFPFALMYYAKDTFGRSTVKWKFLVTKLKEKIYDNKEDVEIFATIIESVYLHVANTLAPSELEEVLDKGEENSRFFTACRRTELANSYNQMIVQMSNEYL